MGADSLGTWSQRSRSRFGPQDKVYYPSLMHRGVAFNNRFGWIRYSPAGFGKDASGYIMTKPTTWITPAVDGNRDTATAFNLLVNLPDRRIYSVKKVSPTSI